MAIIGIALAGVLFFPRGNGPAAVVNGEPISRAELDRIVVAREEAHRESGSPVDHELVQNAVLEQLITDRLLLQGARDAGIVVTDREISEKVASVKQRHGQEAFDKFLADNGYTEQQYSGRMRSRMIKDRFVDEVILRDAVTEEDMREYYRSSPVPFLAPETVEARIVEFSGFEAASNSVAEMRTKGFDVVADWLTRTGAAFVTEYVETNPAYYTGKMGKAMKELEPGTFGGPYKGRDGFFIVRVKSRHAERPKTFDEAREEISDLLVKRDRVKAILRWVTVKLDASRIERNL